ncbi:MAG: hypothetical protein WKF82_03250 [Nocardioidaceae bacterium]
MPRFPGAPQETMYGINANDARVVTRKQALCGSIGVARTCYAGMLPATWDPSKEGASPQYKCHVSFKADPAAVAAGQYDARIVGWLQSIPAGWRVYLTFWHEPNDELREGRFTATSFRAAWSRLSAVVHEVTGLSEGVLVQPVPVFMGYQVGLEGYWSDDWVPHPNEVAFLSWDIYGNPAGGSGLSGGYPTPQSRIDPCLEATERIGFGRWGVSEFNAPARTWDVDESARRTWLTNFHTYARSRSAASRRSLVHPARSCCGRAEEPTGTKPSVLLRRGIGGGSS